MRYSIKNSKVVQSLLIDAPYDSKADAEDALKDGTTHNCEKCEFVLQDKHNPQGIPFSNQKCSNL